MRQRVPELGESDLERVVRRDFADHAAAQILLDEHADDLSLRVRVAAVKSSAGSLDRLRSNLEQARRDEREIIAGAEYPRFMALPVGTIGMTRDEAILADWNDYSSWLAR